MCHGLDTSRVILQRTKSERRGVRAEPLAIRPASPFLVSFPSPILHLQSSTLFLIFSYTHSLLYRRGLPTAIEYYRLFIFLFIQRHLNAFSESAPFCNLIALFAR